MFAPIPDLPDGGARQVRPPLATLIAAVVTLSCSVLGAPAPAQVEVLTQHNDNNRTGANLSETILNTANVNIFSFGKLFSRVLDGEVYAQPLYVSRVTIPRKGVHNVIYVVTSNNTVYAYDADDPRQTEPLWFRKFLNPVPSPMIGAQFATGLGILSTPVIAANTSPISGATGTLYVVTLTLESNTQIFRLHALDLTTGIEVNGSPVVIGATVPGTGDGSTSTGTSGSGSAGSGQ